jgi:hypothetical protein
MIPSPSRFVALSAEGGGDGWVTTIAGACGDPGSRLGADGAESSPEESEEAHCSVSLNFSLSGEGLCVGIW